MPRTLPSQSWSAICEQIERTSGPVSWRWAAARNQGGDWGLVALVVEAGVHATALFHSYPAAAVAVEQLSGEEAARRLKEGRLGSSELVGMTVSFSVPENAVPQWIYGFEQWGLTEIGWPRCLIEIGAGAISYVEPYQPLLAVGLPFYPSLAAAVAERVFRVTPAQLRLGQHPPISIRYADRRGRIAGLEVFADQVSVEVEEGKSGGLAGFVLRAAWRPEADAREWARKDCELAGPEQIELPIGCVPAEFVAVLVDPNGHEVDRRSWDERFDLSPQEPESLDALVTRWLGEGEYAQVEYKQTLKERAARVSFAETVAAFANGAGGVVLIGVNDEGVPVGYDAPKAADQVTNTIAELVEEPPDFDATDVAVEGKPIIVVRVASSAPHRRPHQVKGRVMVRALATTRAATPAQIRLLAGGDAPVRQAEWQ